MASPIVKNVLENYTDLFTVFGAIALIYLILKLTLSFLSGIKEFWLVNIPGVGRNLKNLGEWAGLFKCLFTLPTDGVIALYFF